MKCPKLGDEDVTDCFQRRLALQRLHKRGVDGDVVLVPDDDVFLGGEVAIER